MGMMSLRRRVMGEKKSLPYDAEIEYLESTGTQYIDTGIRASGPISCEARMLFLDRGDAGFLDARSNNVRFYLLHNYLGWCLGYGNFFTSNVNYDNTSPHNIKSFLSKGLQYMEVDGVTILEKKLTDEYNPELNLYMFAQNFNGKAQYYSKARLFSCKIGNVRDYISVRIGTTGYIYDKVSGELFGNQGTGDFILGPDKK